MADKKEVLLQVKNLCQYFKLDANTVNKAVDNVSFDIHKGEVFGLVGESGCGKTTTGRSIIKLYDITSGSVFFKGQRICAGTKAYEDEIKAKKAEIKELKKSGEMALRREGYRDGTWVLLDYGCVAIHVFSQEAREFYDLERLWRDGKEVDLSDVLTAD